MSPARSLTEEEIRLIAREVAREEISLQLAHQRAVFGEVVSAEFARAVASGQHTLKGLNGGNGTQDN